MPHLVRPDGCRLYHELHGPDAGSRLILLEGLGGDIPGWRRNIPHLATEHRVIAYDFRGNGQSDKPYLALYSQEFAREHPDHVAEDILVASQNPQPAHAGRRQWQAIQAWDAWDRLGDIRCPTLVLQGTEDRLISPRNAQMLAERIPGATLFLLEGTGHLYHSEQPEAADRVVLDFLRTVDGR